MALYIFVIFIFIDNQWVLIFLSLLLSYTRTNFFFIISHKKLCIFLFNARHSVSDQIEPDAEICHNRSGSPQHEHVAAGVRAQRWEQDADVRRGEQGSFPGTPGGFQVNLIDSEGRSNIARGTKAADNREIATAKFFYSSLDCAASSHHFARDDIRVDYRAKRRWVKIYIRVHWGSFKGKQSWGRLGKIENP